MKIFKVLNRLAPAPPIGWEFWVPLPLIGLLLWSFGGRVTQEQLRRSHRSIAPLAIAQPPAEATDVLIGKAIIRSHHLTEIEVLVLEPVPRLLKFYWPLTDPRQIEAALAEYFNQSPEAVQVWLRFELRD
ncbi:hypothetical protein [Leptolyngbya sp. PCC 6406]|uniref:hypothetical protein n=1 Tax=Leptolyngbya sp. PCC 6406 TaxID=1173264 RepID=UPI0002AC4405|nr:hypothetical protein [Leptolyngbya sp. PCC 6406]